MAKIVTQKSFEQFTSDLIKDIRREATEFVDDSTEKKIARTKRALADDFFFAATYFPHYIQLRDGFEKECWKNPDAKIDWVKMGFAECHSKFFELTELLNKFVLLAGYSESAKDTLIAKIDLIKKCIKKDIWYHIHVASTADRAASKLLPIRIEFEHNIRLKSDFGDFLQGSDKNDQYELILNNGVKLHGMGRDQTMRSAENAGHRPDWLILNDIWDSLREKNPGIMNEVVDIIKKDYLKRVNSPRWGAILLFNYISKQSPEHLLVQEHAKLGYDYKCFRALVINEKKTSEERDVAHQCRIHKYPDFEKSDWEFRHPTLKLNEERKADPETFESERMMRPQDKKNQRFKDDDFHFFDVQVMKRVEMVNYAMCDPSVKIASDYKAQIVHSVPRQEMFQILCVHAWIRQASIDEMLEESFRINSVYKPKIFGMEGIGFAMLLEREYRRMMVKYGPLPLIMIEKVENKDAKIESMYPIIRTGTLKHDPNEGDQGLLIRQYKGFPDKTPVKRGGIGDDGPDCEYECRRLIERFPAGTSFADYQSGDKREAKFGSGAW